MNKPYNIQNTNICNGIFHISFFISTINKRGRNDPDSIRINILLVLLTLQCVEVDDSKSKIIDQTMQNIAAKNGRKSIPFAKRTTVI
jgi:hypothetical protein